jgi:hypothetical protein
MAAATVKQAMIPWPLVIQSGVDRVSGHYLVYTCPALFRVAIRASSCSTSPSHQQHYLTFVYRMGEKRACDLEARQERVAARIFYALDSPSACPELVVLSGRAMISIGSLEWLGS